MNTRVTNVAMQWEAHLLTVNPAKRRSDLLMRHINDLHAAMKTVKSIFVPVANPKLSAASGSGGIGNIKSGMIATNVLTIDTQMAMLRVSIVYAPKGEFHARRRHQPTGFARATRFN
ncbi:hypothetical protein [Candidatus Nitrotoga arctica]|nr:hypothetical protein [Candidatus Nitrotoga arctica]